MYLYKFSLKLYLASKKIAIMKFGNITLTILSLMFIITSCTPDDDGTTITPPRDRTEVYAEDLEEIETFLEEHYYNYEEFDFTDPYSTANDDFEIVFGEIADDPTKIPLIDRPELKFKMVEDPEEEGLMYKLYYLEVREGEGNEVHFIDQAHVTYEGVLTDDTVFDSAINPTNFDLTSVGLNAGVVTGFREALIEFKTAASPYTVNGDGTISYHKHGIGAAFIPSGLGYFNNLLEDIPSYTPIIFKFSLFDRALLDHDSDGIPSFMENLNDDLDVFDDDTNEDGAPNFFDGDDDGDGVLTRNEIELVSYTEDDMMMPFTTEMAAQDYFDANAASNETLISIDYDASEATYVLNTIIFTDANSDGVADYLDSTISE